MLHFTSGTTGTPKGAVHVHRAVVAHVATARTALDLGPDDVYWCTADPGWVTGTSYGLVAPLAIGATVVVDEGEFDVRRWYRTLAAQRVTVFYTAPTAIRMLMRRGAEEASRHDLSALRHAASVGEPLNAEAVRWTAGVFAHPVHDTWWQTETGAIMIANHPPGQVRPGAMGRPLPGVEAAVLERGPDGRARVDADGGVQVLDGPAEGELALRAGWPSMFRGYLGDPARYAAAFADGWYLTGDVVRRDGDGWFWFVGRADDVIKSAGHLVGPFEVESALMTHPAVAEVGVIGTPDPVAGELVKAFVTVRAGVMSVAEPVPVPTPAGSPRPAGTCGSPLTRRRAAEAGVDLGTLTGTGPGGRIIRADIERAAHDPVPHHTVPHVPAPRDGGASRERPRITPYARRLAADELHGSGPHGAIRARDIPRARAADVPQARATTADRARRATAALMSRANREIPHYYLSHDIDLGPALDRLSEHNRSVPVTERVLPAAVLLHAVVRAAVTVPQLNGHWIDNALVPAAAVHLGVAVSLREGGLVVPVLHDAQMFGPTALMERLRGAAERARAGRLRSSEASGATITVTNLGELGVDRVCGVIHPPQVGLVGFGAVRSRPWADGDAVRVRPVVTATLAADHRAGDGALGARLLREIDRTLHRPEELDR